MYNLYSYKKKKSTGLIITLLIITAIIGGSWYLIYRKFKEPVISENKSFKENVDSVYEEQEIRYDETTDFNLTIYYKCGHKSNSVTKIPKEYHNKTGKEIKDISPQYDIYAFSQKEIYANEISQLYCDNHFIIILNDNNLIAYNKNTPHIIEKECKINTVDFLPDDIEILKNGIEVNSKTEMLEYFESLSS